MGSPQSDALRAPLQQAIDRELLALDRFVARVWLAACFFGGALALFLGLVTAPKLLFAALVIVPYGAWFAYYAWRLDKRGAPPRWLSLASAAVESTIPWTCFLAVFWSQGAAYALASWVPPMVFCITIFSQAVRLQAAAALFAGALGAVVFLSLHLIAIGPQLPADLAALTVYQLPVQISRTFSILALAGTAAFAVRGLRRALGRAESSAREQDLFGKYRLVREIAKGGMASVLEAVYCPEGGFERKVAVKRIHPHLAEQERFVEFFRSEAAISSRLSHPNIVQVLDFGRVNGTYFLSMEFVDGVTLHGLQKRLAAPVPVGVCAFVAVEVLAGLEHAHRGARGTEGRPLRVVHRDLCPQNVLVSTNGEVKITDFGVARALSDAGTSQTNTVVGHLGYISPEQARGEPVDTRSDLFALGVMIWELVAGESLFRRDNDAATLGALIYDPIPRASMRRKGPEPLDPAWDEFLERAIERAPSARFQTAGEMARALLALPGADDPDALGALVALVNAHVESAAGTGTDDVTRVEANVPTGRHHAVTGD